MTTLATELARYRPLLALDRLMPRGARKIAGLILDVGLLALAAAAMYRYHFDGTDFYAALFFVALGPFIFFTLVAFYDTALYYRGLDARGESGLTYEAAAMLAHYPDDLIRGFLESSEGRLTLRRCGIVERDLALFANSKRSRISGSGITLPASGFLSPLDIGTHLLDADKAFADFLFARRILPETFSGALAWTLRALHAKKAHARWWSRENLAKEKGIGAEFSHGIAYELQHYLRPLDTGGILTTLSLDTAYDRTEVEKIETALARARGANALLVGETDIGVTEVLAHLAQDIKDGNSAVSVESKQVVVLDTEAFLATHAAKQEFELGFLSMFAQAAGAGNLIIVIPRLPQFLSSMEALGVDAPDLLERFLASPELHLIGITDPGSYHASLESKVELLAHFSVVHIARPGEKSIVRVLEDVAASYERGRVLLFTYPALLSIAESADRYIIEGVMPDKGVALLVEIVAAAEKARAFPITAEFVTAYVGEKTGIPAGPVGDKERDSLLRLEEILHGRVIGQDEAVRAVASAMRRARSGIESKDRPMGSFLFLGPTGVGKTETAKTLAHVFFGDEQRMLRLDMSEYSDATALSRLLGEGSAPGILPSMLREHPYGVLLLDEFEKSSPEVRNLFLQVLDEGLFTDAHGTRVNARNTIIIATSNAGSALIFDIAGRGEALAGHKEEIVNALIKAGNYTPELLNRFDGVILFEPLKSEEQRKIATLMLEDLRQRIKAKGYELSIDEGLISFLNERGYDPQFGARPMRRLIEETVEEKIAEKIIAGGLRPGDTISCTAADFTDLKKP